MKKTFISEQAKEFRTKYNLRNSPNRGKRTYQKTLVIEEFKEFLEAEDLLFRDNPTIKVDFLK